MPIKEQEITFRVPGVYLLYQLNGAIVNIKVLCRVLTLKSPFVRKIILYVPFAVLTMLFSPAYPYRFSSGIKIRILKSSQFACT